MSESSTPELHPNLTEILRLTTLRWEDKTFQLQAMENGKLKPNLVWLPGKKLALQTQESLILISLIAWRAITLTQQRFLNGNPDGFVTDTTVDLKSWDGTIFLSSWNLEKGRAKLKRLCPLPIPIDYPDAFYPLILKEIKAALWVDAI